MEKIEFDGRDAAKPTRSDPKIKPFLADADDKRTGTVILKDNTPERVISKVVGEAAETREKEAEKFGSVALSEAERKQIDFNETDIPTARAAKGVATGVGVGDWLSYFDETLTASENRQLMKDAKQEDGGRRNQGRETGQNAQRLAQANKARKAQQGGRIRNFALVEQDRDAQAELQTQGSFGDVFDIGFNRGKGGRLIPQGEDFDRLEQRHENRSENAQRVDERRSAKTTRDPVQWTNNPAKYDYPGIDTVQPNELHEQRSERAQEADESELAPPAESKEQWANNQDQYDWPGVDTPPGMALGEGQTLPESEPQETQDRPDVRLAVQEGPSTDREKTRSVMGELQERDVSAAPDELFRGVAAVGYAESDKFPNIPIQSKGGRFDKDPEEEQEEIDDIAGSLMSNFTDDRDQEGQLTSFGMETDATQHRESKKEGEKASSFGVDDRESTSMGVDENEDTSEQGGLERFGGGTRENQTLF